MKMSKNNEIKCYPMMFMQMFIIEDMPNNLSVPQMFDWLNDNMKQYVEAAKNDGFVGINTDINGMTILLYDSAEARNKAYSFLEKENILYYKNDEEKPLFAIMPNVCYVDKKYTTKKYQDTYKRKAEKQIKKLENEEVIEITYKSNPFD